MELQTKINEAYIEAVKTRNVERRDTLKLVKVAIENAIKLNGDATETELITVLNKMIKQREDVIPTYNEQGRADLALKELSEVKVIKEFVPEQLNEGEVTSLIYKAVESTDLDINRKNMGALVKAVVEASEGKTSGKVVSTIINKMLTLTVV